jgi:hemerythrin superfamily protein
MSEVHKYNDKIQELIPELYEALIDKDDNEANKICNSLTQYNSKLKNVINTVRADVKQ